MLQPPVDDFCLYREEDYVIMAVGRLNDYHVNEMTSNRSGFFFNTRGNDLESVEFYSNSFALR